MPRGRLGRSAAVAALLLALQLTESHYALAKFRGAVQKPIPRVDNDGGIVYSVSGIIADLANMLGTAIPVLVWVTLFRSCCLYECTINLQCSTFARQEVPHQLSNSNAQEQHRSWL